MLSTFTLNSDLYPAISTRKWLDMRIYTDCAWILKKATFLKKDDVPEGDEIKKQEELVKSNLRDYLEEGKIDEFLVLLKQTVLGAHAMFFSIDPTYRTRIPMNPYVYFINKCEGLIEEMYYAYKEGYSEKHNLLGSNQTKVTIAVKELLAQTDPVFIFGE